MRKALKDKGKIIVQTIPKKGYLFTGTTTSAPQEVPHPKNNKKSIRMVACIAAVILFFFLIFPYLANTFKQITPVTSPIINKPSNIVANQNQDVTGKNSVTCYDSNHDLYKWISNGDSQPEFYINNKRLPIGEWESHMTMITYLKRKLQEKTMGDKIKRH